MRPFRGPEDFLEALAGADLTRRRRGLRARTRPASAGDRVRRGDLKGATAGVGWGCANTTVAHDVRAAPIARPGSPPALRAAGARPGGAPSDIQEAYLSRAIAEIGRLQTEIGGLPAVRGRRHAAGHGLRLAAGRDPNGQAVGEPGRAPGGRGVLRPRRHGRPEERRSAWASTR